MLRAVVFLMGVQWLCACTYQPANGVEPPVAAEPAPPSVSTSAAPARPSSSTMAPTARLTLTPSAFEDCPAGKPQVAKVQWDASTSKATIVDVVIIGSDGVPAMFATGGTVGEKQSGPWMTPGIVLAVRDHATGAELGRAVAGRLPCTQ